MGLSQGKAATTGPDERSINPTRFPDFADTGAGALLADESAGGREAHWADGGKRHWSEPRHLCGRCASGLEQRLFDASGLPFDDGLLDLDRVEVLRLARGFGPAQSRVSVPGQA